MMYFAYGSNMLRRRLIERTPCAVFRNTALLEGYRLCFHKRGDDGSGKCDAFHTGDLGDQIHGVLYEMGPGELDVLDRIEGEGYARKEVEVGGDQTMTAFTYVVKSQWIEPQLPPFGWYRDFVLAGAREHGLPQTYLSLIQAHPVKPDPDQTRRTANEALLARALREIQG